MYKRQVFDIAKRSIGSIVCAICEPCPHGRLYLFAGLAGVHFIQNVEEWGKKKLAYEIQHMKEGFYYFVHFESDSVCPNEVENHIRIMEPVIRYLCVRQDA